MSSIPIRFGFKDLHSKSEHESGTRLHNHQLGTKCALSVRDGESPQKINRRQAMTPFITWVWFVADIQEKSLKYILFPLFVANDIQHGRQTERPT